jgi:hypothetical protein
MSRLVRSRQTSDPFSVENPPAHRHASIYFLLALALLVAPIGANNVNPALAPNYFAVLADFANASADLHRRQPYRFVFDWKTEQYKAADRLAARANPQKSGELRLPARAFVLTRRCHEHLDSSLPVPKTGKNGQANRAMPKFIALPIVPVE